MSTVKRTERGWAGHFIGASSCAFRRNTLLECGDVKIVVSTVGGFGVNDAVERIGYRRYYETMAFHGMVNGPYIDADVTREVSFDSPWSIGTLHDGVDNDANNMHEAVVSELTRKMEDDLIS